MATLSHERLIEMARRVAGPRLRWPPGNRACEAALLVPDAWGRGVTIEGIYGRSDALLNREPTLRIHEAGITQRMWCSAEAVARLLHDEQTAVHARPTQTNLKENPSCPTA